MAEPRFPAELEREIFERMALKHPRGIPTLLRVARRVLIWIEPLLYRTVLLLDGTDYRPTRRLLKAMQSKPPEFFRAVRHLALWYSPQVCSLDEMTQLLRLCTEVVDLSWGNLADPTLLPILADMHLRRLSLSLGDVFGPGDSRDLTHPLFASVTHLDICDPIHKLDAEVFAQIPAMPALTHLALPFDVPMETALALLEQCPRLQLLLLLWPRLCYGLYEQILVPSVYDPRFVIDVLDDYWKDWEAGVKGLADSWAQGDDFVARKRKGQIEATRYWITEVD
ncbi:hypothetical protein K438DRAFT_1835993 [Mycena galopus ATCC 62051]|nr:hypothetical protein K438DRAFT_1835993 [Mycena galopus ATCC 62051]